jgi:hypothetical protein
MACRSGSAALKEAWPRTVPEPVGKLGASANPTAPLVETQKGAADAVAVASIDDENLAPFPHHGHA